MIFGRKWKDQRIRQQITELQKQWELLSQKLSLLERDKILKTDAEEIFRLEQRIADITAERQKVEQRLNALETLLASGQSQQLEASDLELPPETEAKRSEKIFSYKHLLQAIALGLFIFLLFSIPHLHVLELKAGDLKFKIEQRYKSYKNKEQITIRKEKVIIVALHDDFLEGDTISRKKLAHLINRVSERNPKVIGLDVLLDKSKESDEDLIKAIEAAGNVIIPFELKAKSPVKAPEMLFPLSEFSEIAEIGFANFSKHPIDGIVRELQPVEIKEGNSIYYPFALQILLCFHAGKSLEEILQGNPENTRSLRINFDKEDQFIVLTSDDLESKVFKDFYYEDKIVLIGYWGEKQQHDTFFTPLSVGNQKMRGVFIHANILNTINGKQYIRSWMILDVVIVLLFAAVGGYLFPKFGRMVKFLILPVTWVFYIIVVLFLFLNRIDIPLWSPIITVTLTVFLTLRKRSKL